MDKRKAGICIAAMLGLLLWLYLAGLLGQLLANYDDWLAQGGIGGGITMETVRTGPLFCIRNVATPQGIKAAVLLILSAGGLAVYIVLVNRARGTQPDKRNFKRSSSDTYGTADWMSKKEMQAVLEVTAPDKAEGTILGTNGRDVLCLPADTMLNPHVTVIGASGTGKSRSYIRNHILQCAKRKYGGATGESMIITDPKGELYADMSEYLRENGYQVRVFNLVDPLHGDSWNCMSDLHGDTLMAQVLTDVIIGNTSGDRPDHFWDNGEKNLLKALILYVDQNSALDTEQKSLPEVYRFLTETGEKELGSLFERLPPSHPARAPYNIYKQSSDTVRAGIVLGLGTRLQVLQNEKIKAITRRSDIDLTEPARSKCAYFVILSDQDSSMAFLSSLFFSVLFIRLVRYADAQPNQRCPVPVNIVLDEFNNIGTIGGDNGRDFCRSISTFRSRELRISLCIQSLPQLQNRYPNNLWAEILGNCDTQLMLGCTDDITARFISDRSGDMTVEVNSTMTTRQSIAMAQVIPQYRYTEGLGRRKLLTPDEVLRLKEDILIILRGENVLRAKRFDYSKHPAYKLLKRCSIQDYIPAAGKEPVPPMAEEASAITHVTPESGCLYETAIPPEDF